jgi:hypothetical protein
LRLCRASRADGSKSRPRTVEHPPRLAEDDEFDVEPPRPVEEKGQDVAVVFDELLGGEYNATDAADNRFEGIDHRVYAGVENPPTAEREPTPPPAEPVETQSTVIE